jgi:hypothetical protein
MRIDCHYHLDKGEDAERRNLAELDAAWALGIDKVCAMVSQGRTPEEFRDSNARMAEYARRFPDRVLGYCFVDPRWVREAVDELRRCMDEYGFIGLKLHVSCRCSDPEVFPLVEVCVEHDAPILQHVAHPLSRKAEPTLSDPEDVAELARRYPQAKIIQGHIGGGGDWEWAIKSTRDCPNVYLDTSGSGIESAMIEAARDAVGVGRLVFGTDMNIFPGVGKILGADIPDADKQAIFANMGKLLPGGRP